MTIVAGAVEEGARMNAPIARAPSDGPQLRTILLTDLVDSTALIERLGDVPASELFREHDQLVLALQQRWRGRLIDRSDGLLLLFERPIDGLGFALDYARGLRDLGKQRKLELQARAGLHVGEVLTWKNSDAAVLVGAKPLEVEGLAKPMAARLMTLARPGQILLSAVAEPLARRAARELGERGQNLLWKSYGRWRFKGVPETQEVYEVGEVGIAPLRAPGNTPKAWRDIPLWRRPAALAAEVILLAGLGIGAWFVTKPQPAIAFSERDWVVVGDLRNLTGQSVLDDSLSQAFRISLEQSRYVNVLSDMKARDTLARMQRQPGTPLDRAIASEIALRDGARAVILPTVSEVGGRVRVSAEVIDPHTQTTVYAESADGTGAGSALDSIDKVTASLRGKLGEALASIEKDSEPLPQVTTKNLDALRAYALGSKAYVQRRWDEALQYFERAVQLDPEFALAHLGLMRVLISNVDATRAQAHLEKASKLRDRLAAREQLYLDAWTAEFGHRPATHAPPKWKLMADMYPDYHAGHYQYAWAAFSRNDFVDALKYAKHATAPQEPLRSVAYELIARVDLAQGRSSEALSGFELAGTMGKYDASRRRATALAAMREFAQAEALLEKQAATHGLQSGNLIGWLERIAIPLDRGVCEKAEEAAAEAARATAVSTALLAAQFELIRLSVGSVCQPEETALAGYEDIVRSALQQAQSAVASEKGELVYVAVASVYLAQRSGDLKIFPRTREPLIQLLEETGDPSAEKLFAIVDAVQLHLAGDTDAAIAKLRMQINGQELFQTHVALRDALRAKGEWSEALKENEWLLSHRGLAYVEAAGNMALQSLNVSDANLARLNAAELLKAAGRSSDSRDQADAFRLAWEAELPRHLRRRLDATLPDSKQKTTVWEEVEVR
jgi:putative peptide modification system cyclase